MGKEKKLIGCIAIVFGVLVGVTAYLGFLSYTELYYEDALYQREERVNNDIKIIAIDDQTLSELGDYNSWSRQNYADLVNCLMEDGNTPVLIVFDILFADRKDAKGDQAFADACKKHGNVAVASKMVLRAKYNPTNGKIDPMQIRNTIRAYSELEESTVSGFVNILLDNDGYVRHAVPMMDSEISLSGMSYMYCGNSLCWEEPFIIDYTAGPGSYEMISMSDVLSKKIPASVFNDCIVLVGGCSEGLQESYSVPIDRRTKMYGVEINANILQSFMQQKRLIPVNSMLYSIICGMVAAAYLYLTYDRKVRYMTIAFISGIGIHLLLCVILSRFNIVIPIIYTILALVIAYFTNLIWKYVHERRKRDREMHELLFSMAEAMTQAIDGRTPYNASHTRNVAKYAISLANYINQQNKYFRTDIHFTKKELEQLRLAALLHDVGKLDIPLEVLDKPSRLGLNYEPLMMKLLLLRTTIQLDGERNRISAKEEALKVKQINSLIAMIQQINTKDWLSDEEKQSIEEFKDIYYTDELGQKIEFLSETEYQCLTIAKGTLTASEIEQVREHVEYTAKILEKIHFGENYQDVKKIASSHHELLNGKGYPENLTSEELSPSIRVLTIADIFDALTADDRPYKRAKSKEESFKILYSMALNKEIDKEILDFAQELWNQDDE